MFFEAIISNWLSNGQRPNGMIIRLQGFDKGVFGGNFHTHNSLYLPPGLDVVSYSNGADYVKGIRYAVAQARAGRIVMTVDSTDLLNRRHLFDKDNGCLTKYPTDQSDVLDFDTVITHGEGTGLAIVTYGNGVPTARIAQSKLADKYGIESTVIDSPCLSMVPRMLKTTLSSFDAVLFADVCKIGQHPSSQHDNRVANSGGLTTKMDKRGGKSNI